MPLIEFGAHPIAHQFLAHPTQSEYTHPVTLGFCESCGLTQLIDPIPPEKFYTDYHWLSSWKWNPHVPRLVDAIERLPGMTKESPVFEVGSNDGSFLAALRDRGFKKLLGLEPAQDAVTAAQNMGVETVRAYFTPAMARELAASFGQCELFIARQVLEHVTNLPEFAEAMRLMLPPGARVLAEVPDFGFNQAAQDYSAIWEEHVNHFTADTLTRFLNSAGVEVTHVETAVFSGQILIAYGRYTGRVVAPKLAEVDESRAKALAYRDHWPSFRAALHSFLEAETTGGRKLALFGAGCRSCCLVNYAGLGSRLAFAVDDQPEKQGKFMPGSRLKVCPPEELVHEDVSLCLLAVNAENEEKVIARNAEFVRRGGRFISIHPPSPRLPAFWKRVERPPTRMHKLNDEVLVADEPIVQVSGADIAALKRQALANPRRRIRVCTHPDTSDRLHEMLIVHTRGTYVRPHKHLNKSESVHIIEGEVDVVFLDETGKLSDVVRLGDYRSGREFYYRVGGPIYHTLLISSEFLVFHEITNGPFLREETVFAPWAPEERDTVASGEFLARVAREVAARG